MGIAKYCMQVRRFQILRWSIFVIPYSACTCENSATFVYNCEKQRPHLRPRIDKALREVKSNVADLFNYFFLSVKASLARVRQEAR